MQTFDFKGTRADNFDGHGKIALGTGYRGQLKDLKLQALCCKTLDVESATQLTRLSLRHIDGICVCCELLLPSSLVCINFCGNSLVSRHAKKVLAGLYKLTQVTLGNDGMIRGSYDEYGFVKPNGEISFYSSACMPTMPSSVCRLHVTTRCMKELLDDCAQECLKNCIDMEHLILPLREYPKGGLYEWVKAAPYVRVSDNDPEQGSW